MGVLGRNVVLLELRSAFPLGFSLELSVVINFNIEGLLTVLVQELALIPRVLFGYQL